MSQVASQLILHPVVSQSLKVWATTLGRDKTYRAIQYFARFLAWLLLTRGHKDEAARWNALKAALGGGRKLLRLFKPLEHLQAALRATQIPSMKDHPADQFLTIGRQLGYTGYLTLDAIVWLQSIRFIALPPVRANKINKHSQRFWLAGICFSILHGLLKVGRLANQAKALRSNSYGEKSVGNEVDRHQRAKILATDRASARYQLVQDLLDFWLPASTLGLVNINDGVAGIIGFITSIMAFRLQWSAVGKTMGR